MNSPGNSTNQMEGRIRFCLSDLKRCGLIPVQQRCHNTSDTWELRFQLYVYRSGNAQSPEDVDALTPN
jgi:hypothetical protein